MSSAPPTTSSKHSFYEDDAFPTGAESRSLSSRMAVGGMFALATNFARYGIAIVSSAILSRMLPPEDFGLFAMAATATNFVGLFGDLGIATAIVQAERISRNVASGLFYLNLLMGCAIAFITFFLSYFVADFYEDARLIELVMLLALVTPLMTISNFYVAIAGRKMKWRELSLVSTLSQVISAVVAITLAWLYDVGYWALFAQQLCMAVVSIGLYMLLDKWRPGRVTNWRAVKKPVTFGIYLTGFGVFNYLHRQADNVIVGANAGAAALGYYSRAYNLFMLPLTSTIWPMLGPLTSGLSRTQNDPPVWARQYLAFLACASALAAALAGILIISSHSIVLVVYGPQWASVVPIFQALSITMVLQPLYSSVGVVYISLGRSKQKFWASGAASFIYLAAFLIGIRFGPMGVAFGYTAAVVVILPLWTWLAIRGTYIRGADILLAVAPPVLSWIVAFGGAWLLTDAAAPNVAHDLVRTGTFLLAYGAGLLVFFLALPGWRAHIVPAWRVALAALRRKTVNVAVDPEAGGVLERP